MKAKDKEQTIKCDVESCKYCDCHDCRCTLPEIKVANQKGTSHEKDDTICASFKCRPE